MIYNFCAKSDENLKVLQDRKDKGFESFEMYTTSETFKKDFNDIISHINLSGMRCLVVHVPPTVEIADKKIECGIASLNKQVNEKSMGYIKTSIDLADSAIQDKNKYVIFHPSSDIFLEKEFVDTFKADITERYRKIREARKNSIEVCAQNIESLSYYAQSKNINLCLENMPSLYISNGTKYQSYCSFVFLEDFMKLLNIIDRPNLMFTLDICHLISHIRTMKLVYEVGQPIGCILHDDIEKYEDELKDSDFEYLIVERYINELNGKIGVIHLNNTIEFGMDSMTHAAKFTENEKEFLQRLLNKLKSINFQNPITLEINEKNINNAEGLKDSIDIIKSIIQ